MYEFYFFYIDTNKCTVLRLNHEVRGMSRIIELVFVYLIGVIFLLTLAFRVNEINSESVSNASIANNYTISNYE